MLGSMICGSFNDMDDDLVSSPRRRNSKKGKGNPFSLLGLDKFKTLLADLEEKKQRVYSNMAPDVLQEKPTIKFVTSKEKGDIVPVVLKSKEKGSVSGELEGERANSSQGDEEQSAGLPDNAELPETDMKVESVRKSGFQMMWNWRVRGLRRPSMYLPVALILILMMLMFLGRSMAVMCTSVGWYLFPLLTSKKSDKRRKKYATAASDGLVSNNLLKDGRITSQIPRKNL